MSHNRVTSRPQFGLGIAGGDDGFAAAHPSKGCGGLQPQFPSLGRDQVGNLMRFEVSPHVFDRIEFRSVGGKSLDLDSPPKGGDIVPDQDTAMNRCPIPENKYFPRNVPLEVFQKNDDLGAFDAASVNLEVEPPKRQAANDRKAFPVEGLLEDGRLPARSPGANPRGTGAQSAFIDKDDGSPLLAGFFLMAGHSTRCHFRMAFSSRSNARRSGRWQLKPLAPSNRHT